MSHPRYFELSWPPRPHFLNFVGAKSKSLGSGNHMAHVYLVLASMSDPRYFVLGWPPGSRTLDLVGALGMTSMSDPRLLSLASMSDSHLLGPGWPPSSSALSLATCQIHVTWVWQSCLIHLFFFFLQWAAWFSRKWEGREGKNLDQSSSVGRLGTRASPLCLQWWGASNVAP